jgi:1-deoxy-D-xylulose-5-phosphate reductoisomerase
MSKEDSLFETVIVSANDKLVSLFLANRIKFIDISTILLKISNSAEFNKFRKIKPKNIYDITDLAHYVSLKIESMSV